MTGIAPAAVWTATAIRRQPFFLPSAASCSRSAARNCSWLIAAIIVGSTEAASAARQVSDSIGSAAGQHHRVVITHHGGLPLRGQAYRHNRPILANQLTQRRAAAPTDTQSPSAPQPRPEQTSLTPALGEFSLHC